MAISDSLLSRQAARHKLPATSNSFRLLPRRSARSSRSAPTFFAHVSYCTPRLAAAFQIQTNLCCGPPCTRLTILRYACV